MARSATAKSESLEQRLGYSFDDRRLLERALTHRSAVPETNPSQSYERLEFLGDRVLGLAVAEMLIEAFPDEDEGTLARRFNALVRGQTCAQVAQELGIGAALSLGVGEEQSGGRAKATLLSDACEALIGAIFLDGGFEPACAFVQANWRKRMLAVDKPRRDAKTALQEWSQGQGMPAPVYELMAREGPDHAPMFTVRAVISGLEPATGSGKAKREAEQEAAEALLVKLGLWTPQGPDE